MSIDLLHNWTILHGSPGYKYDYSSDLEINSDGSIYITGSTTGDLNGQLNSGGQDAFISKFNSNGNEEWTTLISVGYHSWSNNLEIDANGSLYIVGTLTEEDYVSGGVIYSGDRKNFISKFNSEGRKEWTKLISIYQDGIIKDLEIDINGALYITGSTKGNVNNQISNGGRDAFISKFNSNGVEEWTTLLGSIESDSANGIEISSDGSLYITGSTKGNLSGQLNNGGEDAFISKFNSNGVEEWTTLLGSIESDSAKDIAISSDGSLYITGDTFGNLDNQSNNDLPNDNFTTDDIFISKFNSNGRKQWTRLFGSTSFDDSKDLEIGPDGNIFITGDTLGKFSDQKFNGWQDIFISKFDSKGNNIWHTLLGSSSKQVSDDLEINDDGSIHLTGNSNGDLYGEINNGWDDAYIISLIPNKIEGSATSNNIFTSTIYNDIITGKGGIDTVIYSGEFLNYDFIRNTNSLKIFDQRSGTNNGTDTLSNIEYIQFSDQTVEESKVDIVKTYTGNFSDYKFYNKGNGMYQIKTDSGYDDITGLPLLTFTGEETTSSLRDISAIVDIKGTFDQVTGLNTDSGKMFRLYNASFKRLPDPDGLKYWIGKYSSGENDERVVASSFLVSEEFKQRYGENVSDSTYVNNLYKNVLGRDADTGGLNYWLGQLNSEAETRYEVLLGFAESAENKALFTEMTGFG